MPQARISVPAQARRGEVIEIKTLVQHPMESGQRRDEDGRPIPRNIIHSLVCSYNGQEVFRAELFPAIAANPYVTFFTTATESGVLTFAWTDDAGATQIETARITVT